MKRLLTLFAAVNLLLAEGIVSAQEINSLMFRKPVESPVVSQDNITFRFRAPKAREVGVSASWMGYRPLPMVQDAEGVWSVTLPVPDPELYTYTFVVDGISTLDPANVFVQRDGSRYMNAVLVPGNYASNYAECPQPGNLEHVWYHSAENDMIRRMYVYTPYGYNRNDKKTQYPVLYLLHGGGGDEDAWSTLGRTCQILDNLIAQGKAKPMFVVMPNGNPNQYAAQTLGIPVKKDVKEYASGFDNYSPWWPISSPTLRPTTPLSKTARDALWPAFPWAAANPSSSLSATWICLAAWVSSPPGSLAHRPLAVPPSMPRLTSPASTPSPPSTIVLT